MAFLTGNGILDKILKLRYAAMNSCVRFEVPTVVLVKIQMLLDVMLCCGAQSITGGSSCVSGLYRSRTSGTIIPRIRIISETCTVN